MNDREQLAVMAAGLVLIAMGARLLSRSAWALLLCGLGALLLVLWALERLRTRERRLQLSPPPRGIVGRAAELGRIDAELRRAPGEAARAVMLIGADGSGKTTLAHAAAYGLRAVFPDAVVYVSGGSESERPWPRPWLCALLASHLLPSATLPALNDEEAVAALRERLAERRVLFVLDHVDGIGADFIRWLLTELSPASALLLLATPPAATALAQLPGLLSIAMPDGLSPADCATRLGDAPLFREAKAVHELTAGNPLLVSLLAGLSQVGEPLPQLLAGLGFSDDKDAPPDLETRVIRRCANALPAPAQRLLRALTVLDDAFTRAHLTVAAGESARRSERALFRAGFLLPDPRPGHYRLHATVRAALLPTLPNDERDAVLTRLTGHVLQTLRQANTQLTTGDEVARGQGNRAARREWPHVLTCQAWAAGRAGELPAAARLCVELGRLTSEVEVAYLADHAATTRRFRDDAVRAARTLGEPEVLLETLLAAGRCCLAQRELQRAADCFEEYRQLAATAAPAPGLQEALAGLAALYAGRAEYDRALARAEQRLELARADTSARAPRRLAEATEQLGGLLSLAGQTERAVEVLGERLKMASEPLERYAVLLPLAEATLRLGNPGAALSHLEEAETLARRHGRPSELATALFCLGRAQMHLGAPRQAQTLLREARATAQAAGQPLSAYDEREAELVGRLGDLALELGDQDQAMMLYEEQLRLAEADPRADIGLALANLALWNALRGDLAAADTHLRRFQDLRADHMRIDSVRRIGHLFLQLGNGGRALTMFREVLAHVRRGRHALEEAAALLDVGMTLRRAGEPRAALTHLRAALSRAQSRKERRIEALASWELGLIHAQGSEIGAAVSALQLGLDYLDAIEYPHSARDYQRNLALLKQLRQQLN